MFFTYLRYGSESSSLSELLTHDASTAVSGQPHCMLGGDGVKVRLPHFLEKCCRSNDFRLSKEALRCVSEAVCDVSTSGPFQPTVWC